MHLNKYDWQKEVGKFTNCRFVDILGKIGKLEYVSAIWADYESIAKQTNVSIATVKRYISLLISKGYLLKFNFKGRAGRRNILIVKMPNWSTEDALKIAAKSVRKLGKTYYNIAKNIESIQLKMSRITAQNELNATPCLIIENKNELIKVEKSAKQRVESSGENLLPLDTQNLLDFYFYDDDSYFSLASLWNKLFNLGWGEKQLIELSDVMRNYFITEIEEYFTAKIKRLCDTGSYRSISVYRIILSDMRRYHNIDRRAYRRDKIGALDRFKPKTVNAPTIVAGHSKSIKDGLISPEEQKIRDELAERRIDDKIAQRAAEALKKKKEKAIIEKRKKDLEDRARILRTMREKDRTGKTLIDQLATLDVEPKKKVAKVTKSGPPKKSLLDRLEEII